MTSRCSPFRLVGWAASLAVGPVAFCAWACDTGSQPLTAELPLHLEEHLDAARIVGPEAPFDVPETIEWRFDEPQPDWKAFDHFTPHNPLPFLEQTEDALRVTLTEANQYPGGDFLHGDIAVRVPDLTRADWSHVLVRARASKDIINLWFVPKDLGVDGQEAYVVNDGTVQTYRFRADWPPPASGESEGPWRELALVVNAGRPSSFDILSVSIVPVAKRHWHRSEACRTSSDSAVR